MLVAKLAEPPQEAWRRGADSAFALNRFDQYGACLRTDRGLRRLDITEGHRVETLDQGAPSGPDFAARPRPPTAMPAARPR